MQVIPNNMDVHYDAFSPTDERIHHGFGGFGHGFGHFGGFGHGFGHFGGFHRPFGFGYGRPFGYGFGFPFLTGLAAGALLSPGYGYPYYGYPYYPYPYPWY